MADISMILIPFNEVNAWKLKHENAKVQKRNLAWKLKHDALLEHGLEVIFFFRKHAFARFSLSGSGSFTRSTGDAARGRSYPGRHTKHKSPASGGNTRMY